MKQILLTLIAIFAVGTANANEDLAAAMKSMGEQFKTVALGLRAGKVTDVELKATEQMQRDISTSALIQPDTAKTTEEKLTYATWMAELMDASLRLEDSMETAMDAEPQDLTEAIKIYTEMGELRKKGHNAFKE